MEATAATFETRCLSSLTKVFADAAPADRPVQRGTALWKETYAFQVAYRSSRAIGRMQIAAQSPLAPYLSLREVGLSPSELPTLENPDPGYLRTAPGLYPDPLYPLEDGIRAFPGQWRSVWVTIALPTRAEGEALPGGKSQAAFPIEIAFEDEEGARLGGETFSLTVISAELPEQKLIHTEWFHADCIATQYGVGAFSEEHWLLLERYIRNAADHGVNMLLTPLFTPPLDTAVGGERPTVQLIGVTRLGEDDYRFDFARLERWVRMCREAGIRYFEFSHLFTQWGAKHAPKIVATVNGEEQRIFGWETDAGSEAYRRFLDQFLPELVRFIETQGIGESSYFHVSDEPSLEHLGSYRQARELLRRHLSGFKFFEALSDYAFYEQGLVPTPVPANNHIEPFLEHGVEPLWTYYCVGQHRDVSNRFFSLPSARNRIIGLQLYKHGVQGFLHWGFNFWYTQYSIRAVDPFRVTDAGGAFPSGDAFVVYPGAEGPIDSLRWEVFREALQDIRALELLESLRGKEAAIAVFMQGLEQGELTFSQYPADAEWLLGARERINLAIAEALGA
ncbi:DUF4091 domain-containing protein [Cohnella nanjingensis]|uniref:DUF4091 domain-containing protein n=1 Tax=Cohnella nanjingensis TaxID=1387779 RepID=A0A7X0RT57_9BACL|nr:DUF4091 domain-containing protein [Cohnella nanjingensis]MBB6673115.1 DUF4091 domain-containing protein [Cohnella nanjingensis]